MRARAAFGDRAIVSGAISLTLAACVAAVPTSRRGLPGDLHVPVSAIVNIADEVVHLSLAHRDVQQMGWEQPPRGDDTLETTPEGDLHRHV